jgi:hypothetical protein
MSAVNLWKPRKLPSYTCFREPQCKWGFVSIAENVAPSGKSKVNSRIWSTRINIFSASFTGLLHST